jgi:hypothetical protein
MFPEIRRGNSVTGSYFLDFGIFTATTITDTASMEKKEDTDPKILFLI